MWVNKEHNTILDRRTYLLGSNKYHWVGPLCHFLLIAPTKMHPDAQAADTEAAYEARQNDNRSCH